MTVVADFRDPEVIDVEGRKVTVSVIPAIAALEIYRSIVPFVRDDGALGITLIPTNVVVQLTKYAAVEMPDGGKLPLDTVDSLERNFSTMGVLAVIKKMYDKNFGFFEDGSLRDLLLGPESGSSSKP